MILKENNFVFPLRPDAFSFERSCLWGGSGASRSVNNVGKVRDGWVTALHAKIVYYNDKTTKTHR